MIVDFTDTWDYPADYIPDIFSKPECCACNDQFEDSSACDYCQMLEEIKLLKSEVKKLKREIEELKA